MAECGICLDVLRSPTCIPCGHIHCERCLKAHISSGADALKSTCPTCRKPFHIATPDFAFVPQKYHDFILPSVRRVFMDVPSVAAISRDLDAVTKRLEAVAKENEHMRQRCAHYKGLLEDLQSEKRAVLEREADARRETLDLRKKYDSLKKRYWESLSRDDEYNTTSQTISRRDSQNFDTSREILPKVEEHPVSLQDLSPNPSRPKRALPKSRLSNGSRRKDESASQLKRQRTHRHSDVDSSSQLLAVIVKCEDEDSEDESE